ncbi:MAG TPA: formate dehydrogenase accessory protein FdhE [Burkholderiaceae bacterium]|nr:formate dehydrogenase accessory protein FdhE [Burkholderiaceae bacterium]
MSALNQGPTGVSRLLSPQEIAVSAGDQAPFLRLPERTSVYADRALRLRQLAAGHAMRDFLLFVADLADAQHVLLQQMPALHLPDAVTLGEAAGSGRPPLPVEAVGLDPPWREVLRNLLRAIQPRLAASPALNVLRSLQAADDEHLDRQADRLLAGEMLGLDFGAAPLIAAALQVCWTHEVLEVQRRFGDVRPFGRVVDATRCPCCGSRPTSSIVRIGDAAGYRYLHCSLCATQWHMVRIKCTHCESTKGIYYLQLEPIAGAAAAATAAAPGAVQLECCEECDHYLKIVHMERDYQVEPVADDLASLTLDILVSDTGRRKHGVDLMLPFAEGDQ